MNLAMRFLQEAHGSQHLYLLGDLFEYWLGDDAGVPLYATFIQALKQLSEQGCAITVMHGNRDFLLGELFAQAAGATLVRDDELVISLDDEPVLLMHGDTLCSGDTDYQAFRQQVRHPQWQARFLDKTVDERLHHAQALRAASRDAGEDKQASIMDVNASTVEQRLLDTGCKVLIHGHTHRPAIHDMADQNSKRLVVGDWHQQHAKFVAWDGDAFELRKFTNSTTLFPS